MSELYRSTTDPRAFPGPKPRSQQMKALRALSYGQSTDGNGIGDFAELRRSIADDGDTLPGRTRGESLEMVNKVIADAEGYDDVRIEMSRRPALKYTLVVAGALFLAAIIGFMLFVAVPGMNLMVN